MKSFLPCFIIQRSVFISFSLFFKICASKGSSLRSLPSQHCGLYPRQRIQLEELAYNTSTRSPYFRTASVWSKSKKSKTDGAPDTKPSSAETVHLPCWRRISEVRRIDNGNRRENIFALNHFIELLDFLKLLFLKGISLSNLFLLFDSSNFCTIMQNSLATVFMARISAFKCSWVPKIPYFPNGSTEFSPLVSIVIIISVANARHSRYRYRHRLILETDVRPQIRIQRTSSTSFPTFLVLSHVNKSTINRFILLTSTISVRFSIFWFYFYLSVL